MAVDRARIADIEKLIRPHVRRTPVIEAEGLTLKLELLQHSGSFKARGAFANLLTREVPPAGVVGASGGNHGAAVAYAAQKLGKPARIYVPTVSSPAKIERIRSYGAHLEVIGDRYADALAASEKWAAESGAMQIHAFDQEPALLGQASVGPRARGAGAKAGHVAGGGRWRRADRWHRRVVRKTDTAHRRGAAPCAHAEQSIAGGQARRCRSGWHSGGFSRAEARRRAHVSARAEVRRARAAGRRRCDPRVAARVVGKPEDCERARRCGSLRGAAHGPIQAAKRGARGRAGLRRQYHRGGFQPLAAQPDVQPLVEVHLGVFHG